MYIMLLKVYYYSFSAFTACMFGWLIDGRSFVCFRVRSITKTASMLVQNMRIKLWKHTVKSTVHGTVEYMLHERWKIQYQFADVKIDKITWWCSSRFIRYCNLNSSYCIIANINLCHWIHVASRIQNLLEESYAEFF